jgi:outer membrane protein assembly factor BamB
VRRLPRWGLLGLLFAATAQAAGYGWRIDGSSVAKGASLPPSWTESWRVPLGREGNASPVLVDDQVCVTVEPTTLACFDAATGRERWRFPHEVLYTLPAAEQAALAGKLEEATRLEAQRATWLKERSAATRAARAGDAAAKARVGELTAKLDAAKARIDEVAWARAADAIDMIGYATPTPIWDGKGLYALFGQGVVARHDADGRLRWARWLGRPPHGRRGYDAGISASPVLADGVLVVPYDALIGLDPATGAERWRVTPYADFGTPAVARVGGRAVLALPDGRLVRASDGKVLAEGLADPWYVGPHADGDLVVWIGGHAVADNLAAGFVPALAYRLSPSGDGVVAKRLWRAELSASDLFYTAPVIRDGKLFSVSRSAELRVLDLATGAELHHRDLLKDLGGFVYASPTLVGDRLLVGSEKGVFVELATTAPFAELARHEVQGQHRATPALGVGRAWFRPLDGLVCVGCR